jgi:hypothetical protein
MTNQLIQPPEIIEVAGPVIFLAGPIQDSRPWQYEAAELIHDIDGNIVVASPRKEYAPGEFVYEKQVDWETHFLERAARYGAVLFWLARQTSLTTEPGQEFPRPHAQTTRQELGEWRNEKKHNPQLNLVVGIEPGFSNKRYICRRLNQVCPDVPILDDLADTCRAAVDLIR